MRTPSKPTFALSALLLAVLAAGTMYAMSFKTAHSPAPTPTPSTAPAQSSAKTSQPAASGTQPAATGRYVEYKPGIIEETRGSKVLFFHAPWCPQCRTLDASILAGTIPDDTTIIKVDYDSNQALRNTYGVTLQTSLVRVDDSGRLVKKFVAYEDPSLEALIKNVL